jgi:hypothetical protein
MFLNEKNLSSEEEESENSVQVLFMKYKLSEVTRGLIVIVSETIEKRGSPIYATTSAPCSHKFGKLYWKTLNGVAQLSVKLVFKFGLQEKTFILRIHQSVKVRLAL